MCSKIMSMINLAYFVSTIPRLINSFSIESYSVFWTPFVVVCLAAKTIIAVLIISAKYIII